MPVNREMGRSIFYPHPPLRMAEIRTLDFLAASSEKWIPGWHFVGTFEKNILGFQILSASLTKKSEAPIAKTHYP